MSDQHDTGVASFESTTYEYSSPGCGMNALQQAAYDDLVQLVAEAENESDLRAAVAHAEGYLHGMQLCGVISEADFKQMGRTLHGVRDLRNIARNDRDA